MADYSAQIRLAVQGLPQLDQLERRLENATRLLNGLQAASSNLDQAAESASRRAGAAGSGVVQARQSLAAARRRRVRDASGRFAGPDLPARRRAEGNLRLAEIGLQQEARALREINGERRRYAARLRRAGEIISTTRLGAAEIGGRVSEATRRIAQGSRGNYLTNLFQGRQREFARGGAGAQLAPELQRQAQNVRAAWDIATAGGRENLQLMQRLATEMAGLVRQQNELNRGRAGRSTAFEAGRRGQERITDLSRMQGADPAKVRRLRSQATNAIATGFLGDIAGSKDAQRRMNASIDRYRRELDAAAQELSQQQRAGVRNLNVRSSWQQALSGLAEIGSDLQSTQKAKGANLRTSWQGALNGLAEIGADIQTAQKAKGINLRANWQNALDGLAEISSDLQSAQKAKGNNVRANWQTALSDMAEIGNDLQAAQKAKRTNLRGSWQGALDGLTQVSNDLQSAQKAKSANTKASWRSALDGLASVGADLQSTQKAKNLNIKNNWQSALDGLANVSADLQSAQKAKNVNIKNNWQKALDDMSAVGADIQSAQKAKSRNVTASWQKALDDMAAIGADIQRTAAERGEKGLTGKAKQESAVALREDRLAKLAQQGADVSQLQIRLDKAKTRVGDESVKAQEKFKRSILKLDTDIRRLSDSIAKAPKGAKAGGGGAQPPGFFRGGLRQAVGEGLIGGAFPLLFGQGLGASAGGFAGGFGGGLIGGSFGFGLSLIGTALGSVVDTAVNKLGTLGGALGSAADSIGALEEAGVRVRDSQKIQVAQLEKVGRGYEAQQVVLREIESRLGPGSVAQVERLNDAQKELSDAWAQLSLQLGVTLIPVIIEAANLIRDLLGGPRGGTDTPTADPRTKKPRKPSQVIADIDALIALNEANRAGNREYAGLVRDVEDFRRDNEEKIFQMRRQAGDIEKQKSDLRLDVENKIFDMRQETARLEIENARSRAQIAIESFDLDLARRADALGGGGGEFIDQVRDYLRAREQGEADLQAKEKTNKLQIAASERELQQYILQVSDKVAAINRAVEDYKRDQEKFRFESVRRIEDYRIKVEDYIYNRVKDRYEYAIGSEKEILRLKMEAAMQLGAGLPPDAGQVLGGAGNAGPTAVSAAGLANPLGPQSSGRPPNWNQGLGAGRGHQGQDLGVDVGTTIHAIEDAVVEGVIKGFGKAGDAVVLRYTKSGNVGVYGHVNPLPSMTPGRPVGAGQQIGVVTPDIRPSGANNTHLHYEYWRRNRGRGGELLDPTQRLRGAMSGRSVGPQLPATPSQQRVGPRMLLPGASGPAPRMFAPGTTDTMLDRRSSLPMDVGQSLLSQVQREGGFEDVAMTRGQAKAIIQKLAQEAQKGNITPDAFANSLSTVADFAHSPDESRRTIRNLMATPGAKTLVGTPALAPAVIKRLLSQQQKAVRGQGVNTQSLDKHIGPAVDIFKQLKSDGLLRSNVSLEEVREKIQKPLYGALMDWIKENLNNPQIQKILGKSRFGQENTSFGPRGLAPMLGGFDPKSFGVPMTPAAQKENEKYLQQKRYEASPEGKREREYYRKLGERMKQLERELNIRSEALPADNFDVSRLEQPLGLVAQAGELAGLVAPPPLALPAPGQPIPQSQRMDAFSTVAPPAGVTPGAAVPLNVQPFTGSLPSYAPAPMAAPAPPAPPQLPPAPPPMIMPDTSALTKELGRQKEELLENVELLKKMQELENGRLLLQLASTREVRNRLEDAAKELSLETDMLDIDRSLSQDEQDRAAERIRTIAATEELNGLQEQSMGFAKALLDTGKLQQQEYDQITQGLQERIRYEKDLLQIVEDRAEVARLEAFNQRLGEVRQETRLTGAGLRAGIIGEPARRFEQELAASDNLEQANQRAEEARLLEDQQLIWANLEKNIVDVSDAISGALTNGLLDIVSGAKDIEDVGRDMLNGIARTFADSAQQQLSTLLQRQIAQFAGPKLAEMIGGGPSATGPQALGAASQAASSSIWALNNAALAASTTLQSLAAQATASAALSGTASSFSAGAPNILGSMFGGASGISTAFSSAAGGIGSAFSSAAPDILGSVLGGASALPSFSFGGFLANGGTTSPDEAYIVGEKEPEFFFPGASGRVVPKSDLEKAAALAEENADNEPIDIRYTVTEQAGQRYVTEDQFRKGMSATSKRAQAMTLGGLRNNKQDRDYVGMG